MLEQLKEVIMEMELLMQDCCVPVSPQNNTNSNLKTNPPETSTENVSTYESKSSKKEPFIRVDPCLASLLSSSFFGAVCANECNIDSTKEKVVLCRLKQDLPNQYESILLPENFNGNDLHPKIEFPVKLEQDNTYIIRETHITMPNNVEPTHPSSVSLQYNANVLNKTSEQVCLTKT